MREDYGSLSLVTHDQGFGDMSFDVETPDLLRHTSHIEAPLDQVRFKFVLKFKHILIGSTNNIYFVFCRGTCYLPMMVLE